MQSLLLLINNEKEGFIAQVNIMLSRSRNDDCKNSTYLFGNDKQPEYMNDIFLK